MSIKKLNPYLMLDGTAEKAIQFYERALGAKAENLMRYGDVGVPERDGKGPEHKDRIVHARLRIGDELIMISDCMPGTPGPTESRVHIALDFDDVADMTRKFDALAVGGKVTMPLHDAFWGAKFGTLTDAFDISWMFNCEIKV